MFIILYPEDLSQDFKGNKEKPKLGDFKQSVSYTLAPADVILYKYENQTLILKGPEV
jgi:hypothetical protein